MRLPYARVDVSADGVRVDPAQTAAAVRTVTEADATAVVVMVHGWNNTAASAEQLYDQLAARLADRAGPEDRLAVVGVVWPSTQWAEEPRGGGGALSDATPEVELRRRIDAVVDDPDAAARLRAAADALGDDPDSRAAFVAAVRESLLPPPGAVADDDPIPLTLSEGDADELFDLVREGMVAAVALAPPTLDDAGAAAGFSLGGLNPFTVARTVVNTASYYRMKDRAGKVGAKGITPLVRELTERTGRPVTLVGHSFGARAATAAVAAGAPAHALCLLQGAFSHVAFTERSPVGTPGAFRAVLAGGSFTGPVVVTHTHNDRAVLLAYAIASRVAKQVASDVGDRNDPYGGIGANGALGLAAAEVDDSVPLGPADTAYTFTGHRVHNLRADRFVGGHSDITGPEVANAVYQAVTTR